MKRSVDPVADRPPGPANDRHRSGEPSLPATPDRVLLVGVGSLGRPLAQFLVGLPLAQLTLVDPKKYRPLSVETQCDPSDVHRLKVDVVGRLVKPSGILTTAMAEDICDVPDGIVGPDTLIITCVDNPRALIRANRMAIAMGAWLLKLNIEPLVGCLSLRAYDLAHPAGPCAECQLSARHYQQQRHPRSCDAATGPRRTAGSRALAMAAAERAFTAASAIRTRGNGATDWLGWETIWNVTGSSPIRSRLEPYDLCRCVHGRRWPNVFRLSERPEEISLCQLLGRRHRSCDRSVAVRVDQHISLRGRCLVCLQGSHTPHWVSSVDTPAGRCQRCGSLLRPVPFYLRRQVSLADLWPVIDVPMSTWGVVPGAVIQTCTGGHTRSFVVGDGGRQRSKSVNHQENNR